MPRKRENEPRVTMSGGILRRVINAALSAPPRDPASRASAAAAGMGRPATCHAAPKITAASAIMDPTERSIPPVITMGVMASDNKPNSTLRRITSKRFSLVKKFSPMAAKMAISKSSTKARTHSPLGNQRSRQALCSVSGSEICIAPPLCAQGVHGNGGQDDAAFYSALPVGGESEKG